MVVQDRIWNLYWENLRELLAKCLPRTQENEWSKNWTVMVAPKEHFLIFVFSLLCQNIEIEGTSIQYDFSVDMGDPCQSQWPGGLRRGSAVTGFLGLRVRILRGAWMSVSSECCFFSGRGVCESGWSLVQKSPTECGVSECDRETVIIRGTWPNRGVAPWNKGTFLD
jgi:hypothetical protein